MSEILLFEKDKMSFKEKFYTLMNILTSNQTNTRLDSTLFLGIFFLQIISGFFSEEIGVLDIENSFSDRIFNYLSKILRLKDLFIGNYKVFRYTIIVILAVVILFTIYILICCYRMTRDSFYTYSEAFINFYIKTYIYIAFNIILDLTLSNICFESNDKNPNWPEASCNINKILNIFIISMILLVFSIIFVIFIQFYYCDSLYLSTSFYAKISCNYEILSSLNGVLYSVFLIFSRYVSTELFLIYNLLSSVYLLNFFISTYLFYDRITNITAGMFHALYAWTSVFFLFFKYIKIREKGLIYLASSVIVLYLFFNIKFRIEENILLTTPFYQIKNQYYILYYIKNLIDKINHFEESPEEKGLLTGIMEMHAIECPTPSCESKSKTKIYLPITNEWSDRSKPLIEDKVYLMNFILFVMNYFIGHNYYSANMVINMSLYYLENIGNFCQAMFYYKKVKEMKLTLQEQFSFARLRIKIQKALGEKFKAANEPCLNLEDLNISMYFKYENLSKKFFDEMNNDVNLSLEFWRTFKNCQIDNNQSIDFNKIFYLTDKIRLTKIKVEKYWNQLVKIFNGVNELFELYLNYVEQINDDDLLKRNLEEVKRKNENSADNLQQNFYSLLFNKETGIIIANGDKGKEGIIEKANPEIEAIFKYKPEEIKGMNLSTLMPKLFAKQHKSFIEKYYDFGEKRVIDKKDFKSFGLDKENSIILLKLAIKIFPMLNECVYFVGLVIKENIDDIIFLDSQFNIEGISQKIMKILHIDNKFIFQDNEIPFYVICKKFVNFYKIFLQGKKMGIKKAANKKNNANNNTITMDNNQDNYSENAGDNQNKKQQENELTELQKAEKERLDKEKNDRDRENELQDDNIEINENIELEYEIKLPKFLLDYLNSNAAREQKNNNILFKSNSEITGDNKAAEAGGNKENANAALGEGDDIIEEDLNELDEENDLILNEKSDKGNNSINNLGNNASNAGNDGNTPTPTPDGNNINIKGSQKTILNGTKTMSKGKMTNMKTYYDKTLRSEIDNFNKPADEEKEFITKVTLYRELFDNKNFSELETLIDECNNMSPNDEFKFNFTFDRYKYGIRQVAFIVRCIDNKAEGGIGLEDSLGDENIQKNTKYRKERTENLKPLYEIVDNEKEEILNRQGKFVSLSLEDKNFQSLLNYCKEDINLMSAVLGKKRETIVDDENSSQSSNTGFNADLCKKNRIEEIRNSIMKNVTGFYTLKYIQLLGLSVGAITLVFCIVYLIFFNSLYDDLRAVCKLNTNLFQTTIWMSNIVTALISLRTLYRFQREDIDIKLNTYVKDYNNYFNTLKQFCFDWYDSSINKFGFLENQIEKYIKENDTSFWGSQDVTYSYTKIKDSEGFSSGFSQVLTDINSLIQSENFVFDKKRIKGLTTKEYNYLRYASFLSIENANDNLLPNQFKKLADIPEKFKAYNKDSIKTLLYSLILYGCVMIIFCVIYDVFLYITNQNMGEGLLKVSKIRVDKIDDVLKKIECFNDLLIIYRDKDNNKYKQYSEGNQKVNFEETVKAENMKASKIYEVSSSSIASSSGFSTENKKHKELNILKTTYFQSIFMIILLCGMLIPMYILTNNMVNSTNKLIGVQIYLFGKVLESSANIVKVKCMMSKCEINTNLDTSEILNKASIQTVVQGISVFSELADFYNNKFLSDACLTAFGDDTQTEGYKMCTKEVLVQSANNTDSLLNLIDETIDNLYKEYDLKFSTEENYDTYYLFESSAFSDLENIYFNYIEPVNGQLDEIFDRTLKNYLNSKKIIVIILIVVFGVVIFILCGYIGFIFIKNLAHLLLVSRSIFRIIPTVIIMSTQELVTWIENKY